MTVSVLMVQCSKHAIPPAIPINLTNRQAHDLDLELDAHAPTVLTYQRLGTSLPHEGPSRSTPIRLPQMGDDEIRWLSTADAAKRVGITPRTLYRFIDNGELPAYRFGRVIRLKESEVDTFIESCRIEPGSLEHLYPDAGPGASDEPDEDDEAG